ncbi:MAG: sulfur carrier protein ThiS [Kordiimonadaceae bacterium]|nr:sulfur carrier protein ThiS [Kordiimonadaceae bacterium]MBO6570134.1 sulfur carrier protein ThiS [Kordiimonadaceae bacterium]MBO6965768.1 sulfur carrier protein ThiS [Kordiimonadaceae bacterium]
MSISITVNGEAKTTETGQSVWSFLEGLQLDPKKVAVERNLEIVSKSLFRDVTIEEGDQLEIVHFIGGG